MNYLLFTSQIKFYNPKNVMVAQMCTMQHEKLCAEMKIKSTLKKKEKVKNDGVILDCDLSFKSLINQVRKLFLSPEEHFVHFIHE